MIIAAILALSTTPALADSYTLSADSAVAVHLAPAGLDRIGESIAMLAPEEILISSGSNVFDCSDETSLDYVLSDLQIWPAIDSARFVTDTGSLSFELYGTLSSSVASMTATGDCSIFENLNETCQLQIPTTAFSITANVTISELNNAFIVESDDVIFSISPITNPVTGCVLEDAVGTLLGQNSQAINDLITDAVQPSLDDLPAEIESALTDALNELTLSEQTAIFDTAVDISLEPALLAIDERGIILGMSGDVSVPSSSDCIDDSLYEPPEEAEWPSFDGLALNSSMVYEFGVFFSRQFTDNVLYAAWKGGALCLDVASLTDISISGDAAGAFFGEEFSELVGPQPVVINITGESPPRTLMDDDQPPVSISLNEFALDVSADVDFRKARIFRADLATDIDIPIELSANQIATEVVLDSSRFAITETYSELLQPGYSQSIPGLLDLALGSFSPSMPTIQIPVLLGISVSDLSWGPSSDDAWQGGYLFLNTDNVEPLVIPGCSASDLGCEGDGASVEFDLVEQLGCADASSGCDDAGCASGGRFTLHSGRTFGITLVLLTVFFRRRV